MEWGKANEATVFAHWFQPLASLVMLAVLIGFLTFDDFVKVWTPTWPDRASE